MEVLDRAHRQDFERRLVDHLYRVLGASLSVTPRANVVDAVSRGAERAFRYGVTKEKEVAALLVVWVQWKIERPRSAEPEWVAEILAQTDVEPGVRVRSIQERFSAALDAGSER
ncbi:MAG: hypothetical protein HC923_08680 [Myxococcales bacterium]|nr:hypothetical protein [Myxococcales bacterium]